MRTLVRRWSLFLLPALAACGLTDLLEPLPDEPAEVREYEDHVVAVDLTVMSFTLEDGVVVRMVDDTERQADEQGRNHDLLAVHEALEAALPVLAWGKGEVTQEDPVTLDAVNAGFAIQREVLEYEGKVASVDLGAALFVMQDGTTVKLAEHSERKADEAGDVHELEEVHAALEDGLEVLAWGAGELEDEEPLVLEALRVGFEIEEVRVEDFNGVVVEVHLVHDKFQLADGTYVRVTDRTELVANGGIVITLAAMHLAVQAGLDVVARGVGEVENEEPLVLEALRLEVEIGSEDPPVDPNLEEFEGRVDFVDAGMVFLLDGTEVVVNADTEIVAANDYSPASMDELMAALEAGRVVRASGAGTIESEAPLRISAVRVVFEIQVVEFEGDVSFVDAGAIFLVDGTFVLITEETVVSAADADSPSDLGGVDQALAEGDGVRAFGSAIVTSGGEDPGEPMNVEAITITFLRVPAG